LQSSTTRKPVGIELNIWPPGPRRQSADHFWQKEREPQKAIRSSVDLARKRNLKTRKTWAPSQIAKATKLLFVASIWQNAQQHEPQTPSGVHALLAKNCTNKETFKICTIHGAIARIIAWTNKNIWTIVWAKLLIFGFVWGKHIRRKFSKIEAVASWNCACPALFCADFLGFCF